MTDRFWSTEEQRWIYAHESHLKAETLREAAASSRWDRDEHRHVRQWLLERADRIEAGDGE